MTLFKDDDGSGYLITEDVRIFLMFILRPCAKCVTSSYYSVQPDYTSTN